MATAQGVKLCQLRAATNLAELLLNLRNESAAHALLEPICGSFTEGANMRHLISARTLLAALGK
jgi:predicted ATPase